MKEKIAIIVAALKNAGYVRVDGLFCTPPHHGLMHIIARGECEGNEIRYDHNNGKKVVVMPDRTVWLGVKDDGELNDTIRASGMRLTSGTFVPCSNGEALSLQDVLCRLADHEWVPPYHTSEEARAAGF